MSSSKKKIHYDSTKRGKGAHRSSREDHDSGIGSSTASDRASISVPSDSQSSHGQIEDQRQILGVVQEALDSANERIRQLERDNSSLNLLLSESNKENRLLKRERSDLLNKVDSLMEDLENGRAFTESLRHQCVNHCFCFSHWK